jgi:ribosomal protein S18 acetylase RimI-like enzyme
VAAGQPRFKIEPLGSCHDRAAFACESEAQTGYFRNTARQHTANAMSAVFVMVETATARIAGYYTLSMHSIDAGEVPPQLQKTHKLPKGGALPAALIGRLARDLNFKGQRIGPMLAYDALKRVRDARDHIGCVAVIVDPDGEEARRFWIKLRFHDLPGQSRLFLPAGTIQKLP